MCSNYLYYLDTNSVNKSNSNHITNYSFLSRIKKLFFIDNESEGAITIQKLQHFMYCTGTSLFNERRIDNELSTYI